MSGKVLGIDLGTTNSVVAIANGKESRVLADSEGRRLIPSVVSFHPDGSILVGHEARERRLVDAKNTVYSTKRLIGRPYSSSEVQRAKERFAFDLEPTKVGGVQVRVRRGTFALPEISAMVLRHLRRVAEDALGEPCGRAVVTVPANFNELQRSATQAAGKVAGLEVLRILNEPTAATLAYGLSREKAEKVAVYDLGGGTFDITVLDLDKDVFEVVSTAGDTFLGGDDIDLMIAEKMADACLRQHRFDARVDSQAFERMRAAAEWAKCQLSSVKEVDVTLEELFNDGTGASVDFTFHLTRLELEALIRPMIARTFDVVNDALRASGRRPKEIDSVVLVGGSTRIPMVRAMVDEFFGRAARIDIDPDLVVAQGAAIHGFAIAGDKPAPGKALARVALKKVTKQITAVREERMPRQQAFAPEEGRDDRQARVVDEGVPDAPPPIPRQPTQPNIKAPTQMSPLARAAAHLETPKKEVSTPNRPAATAPTDAFEFGDVPTTVGKRPEVEALLAREAAERAKATEELTAEVRLPDARGEAERKPQRGGTYPGASHGSSPIAAEAKRPAPLAAFGEPERTPESREVSSAPVVAIRTVGVVGVGAPPASRDDDAFDAQPTRISEPPKPTEGKRKRQPTLMGALPGADAPFGIPEPKAAPPPPVPEPPPPPPPPPPVAPVPAPVVTRPEPRLELSSSAFQIDDVDPELAETLREAEAALSRPVGKRAEPARPVRTREVGELPMPGAAPIEIGEPPVPAAPTGVGYTQPGPFAPAQQQSAFAPAQSAFSPAAPAPASFAPAQPAPQARAPQPAPAPFAQPAPFAPAQPAPQARAPQPAPTAAAKPLAPRQPVVAMPDRAAPLLMDVTPLSLGVETAGGYCQQIVQRNAPIPTEKSRVFATAKDGQTEVELKICQGESNRYGENQSLGALMIGPLRQAKRGDVRIEITFMIDQNGILDVKATDLDARRAQAIRIALRGGVDVSEIDAMRQRQESLFQQGQ